VGVANAGTLNAGPRRYGYYLSSDATLDLLSTGLVDTSKDVFLGSVDGPSSPLLPGASDTIGATSVTIPLTTAPGTWYLFQYADDLRKVSELNENNNIVLASVITITADTTPPVIDAHATVTGEATGPGGATVTYVSPAALDAVDGPVDGNVHTGVRDAVPARLDDRDLSRQRQRGQPGRSDNLHREGR
jgi:CARDB.